MTFGNRTMAVHLARGMLGFGALALAAAAPIPLWWRILLLPAALVALKGCPACWTIGLFETLAMRVHAEAAGAPPDGARGALPARPAAPHTARTAPPSTRIAEPVT